MLFLSLSKKYHSYRAAAIAECLWHSAIAAAFHFERKRRKTMLNTLLSVIRAILVELVDQLLRKVCTLG
ncbi:MAG: hypothetical protein ACLUJG_04245 [Lawsonibacter sp.]